MFRHFFSLDVSADEAAIALSETAALVNQLNSVSGKCMDRFETILLALQRIGFSPGRTNEDYLLEFFKKMDALFEEYPPFLASEEIPALMTTLSNDFTFSILSNTLYIKGSSLSRFFAMHHMSGLFRFQIYSDEVNMSKPSAGIFRQLIEKSDELCAVSIEKIVHIGDNAINDVEGASKAGLRALLLDQKNTLAHYFRR